MDAVKDQWSSWQQDAARPSLAASFLLPFMIDPFLPPGVGPAILIVGGLALLGISFGRVLFFGSGLGPAAAARTSRRENPRPTPIHIALARSLNAPRFAQAIGPIRLRQTAPSHFLLELTSCPECASSTKTSGCPQMTRILHRRLAPLATPLQVHERTCGTRTSGTCGFEVRIGRSR